MASREIWQVCAEAKDKLPARVTYQDIADQAEIGITTVAQFMRGETKHPGVYTVGAICRVLGVSLDAYFNIYHDEPQAASVDDMTAAKIRITKLESDLAGAQQLSDERSRTISAQRRSAHHRDIFIAILVFVTVAATIADMLVGTNGWLHLR